MDTSTSENVRPEAKPPMPPFGACVKCGGPVKPIFLAGGRVIAPKWLTPDLCAACDQAMLKAQEGREKAERARKLAAASNLPPEALAWDFDRAEAAAHGVKADRADMELWHRAFYACRHWPGGRKGLYLYGDTGTGKTVLAWCLLVWALTQDDPLTGFFLPVGDLADKSAAPLAKRAKAARILVLDDIGAVRPTRALREALFDIVDSRARSRLPTVYTSNYGPGELDKRLRDQFGRVIDRIVGSTDGVPVMGKSFRVLEAEQRWR